MDKDEDDISVGLGEQIFVGSGTVSEDNDLMLNLDYGSFLKITLPIKYKQPSTILI